MQIVQAAFYLRDATVGAGGLLKETVVRVCLSCCTVIVLLWVAILMYISFYYAYMPTVHHSQPVYLQFSPDCTDKPDQGLCSFPEANVTLSRGDRVLMRGQRYQVYLDLDMPQSPVNEKLGMFMVTLKFLAQSGKILATSSRSSMLHFKSGFLKGLSTMFMSFPLVFGFAEESQIVPVKLFENYVDDSYHPVTKINVVVAARKIEIYGANIRIEAEFSGFRYILFNYPIASALVCISTNFITACILFFFAYHAFTPDNLESEQDDILIDADGSQHLYGEARRRDLRSIPDGRICRTPSPVTAPNAGRLKNHTRNKESIEPIDNLPPRRRLRSVSFPSCRWDEHYSFAVDDENDSATLRSAPCTSRRGRPPMHSDLRNDGVKNIYADRTPDTDVTRDRENTSPVDNIQPLTFSTSNQMNSDSPYFSKSKRLEKSLSFESGVEQIYPPHTILPLSHSHNNDVSSLDESEHRNHMDGAPTWSERRIPDGAPAESFQSRSLVRAKSEEHCSLAEDKKSLKKRVPFSKNKQKFGSSFRRMLSKS